MADKAKKAASSVRPAGTPGTPKDRTPTAHRCIGAEGYGLNNDQQKAIVDLWAWQEQSLRSEIVLGGPVA
jgi:hypothetical protein